MSDLLDTPPVTPTPTAPNLLDDPTPSDQPNDTPEAEPTTTPTSEKLLAGKYKTPEDLEKAYQELTTLHRKKQEIPEKYDLKVPGGFTVDDDMLAKFKEAGLTQKQAQHTVEVMAEHILPKVKEASRETQELLLRARFGYTPDDETYPQFIAELRDWATENLPDEVVSALRRTPEGVLALHKLRKAQVSDGSTTPTRSTATRTKQQDFENIQKEMRDPRYIRDANYRNEINERIKKHMAA